MFGAIGAGGYRALAALAAAMAMAAAAAPPARGDHIAQVFDKVPIGWSDTAPPMRPHDPYILRHRGQEAERTIQLPPLPGSRSAAKRIIARVTTAPVMIDEGEQMRIADPWTRLGHITVFVPDETAPNDENAGEEIEIMRFITGYGGATTYECDVSSYAPILTGDTIMRVRLGTWTDPAWEVSLTLEYLDQPPGYRRPAFVKAASTTEYFTSRDSKKTFEVEIPEGVRLPRLHIITTGHGGPQEFATAMHALKIDNGEIARWRPWREDGGTRHDMNPMSERWEIEGRELWSSDLDRAGWMPASLVEPVIIPAPELTPGKRTIELEISGIRPMPEDATEALQGSYWVVSITVVADEPWPAGAPSEEEAGAAEGDGQ